jgi:hypothetical protein
LQRSVRVGGCFRNIGAAKSILSWPRVEADMSGQRTLASVVYDTKRKVTRRERFLQEMDRAIPWSTL